MRISTVAIGGRLMFGSLLRPGPCLTLLLLVHILSNVFWFDLDRHLPDGDESGHIGAIELYRDIIRERGLAEAASEAFYSPSEYPPLFALANAAPLAWMDIKAPFPAGVPILLTFWSSLTLLAIAGLTYSWAGKYPKTETPQNSAAASTGTKSAEPVFLGAASTGTKSAEHVFLGATSTETKSAEPLFSASPGWMAVFSTAAYLTFPLSSLLGRHTMLEPFVALWVVLAYWAASVSEGFSRTLPTLGAALAVSAGLLTKQTFALYVAIPFLLLALGGMFKTPRATVPRLLALLLIATPLPAWWVWMHVDEQLSYGLGSAAAKANVVWLEHFLYYPAAIVGVGLGFLWTGVLLMAMCLLLLRKPRWPVLAFFLVLMTLSLVPKKYPRMLVPVLPLAAVAIGLGVGRIRKRELRGALMIGAAIGGSVQQLAIAFPSDPLPPELGLWRPAFFRDVDPGCPQIWIRRAGREELGFDELLEALNNAGAQPGESSLAFVKDPKIPCAYETTFGYAHHFFDYARRHGLELSELPVGSNDPESFERVVEHARVIVDTSPWCEEPDGGLREGSAPASSSPLFCRWRHHFGKAIQFEAECPSLSFTLYLYPRKIGH